MKKIKLTDVSDMYKEMIFRASPECEAPLKELYEYCCQEYVRRLCEAWEIHLEEVWWICDEIGGGLFLPDFGVPLDMQELRYVVENNVTHEAWMEYCDFVESEINNGRERPRINFRSWFSLNARPENL